MYFIVSSLRYFTVSSSKRSSICDVWEVMLDQFKILHRKKMIIQFESGNTQKQTMESKATFEVEGIYKIKPYKCVISGKIKKCDENLYIKDGQKFSIQLGSQKAIGQDLTYGHKTKQLKIGDYYGIAITGSDLDVCVGNELIIVISV